MEFMKKTTETVQVSQLSLSFHTKHFARLVLIKRQQIKPSWRVDVQTVFVWSYWECVSLSAAMSRCQRGSVYLATIIYFIPKYNIYSTRTPTRSSSSSLTDIIYLNDALLLHCRG